MLPALDAAMTAAGAAVLVAPDGSPVVAGAAPSQDQAEPDLPWRGSHGSGGRSTRRR
ncbi:hypothetical protein [Modestobacter sp. VKM Ac-2978]|uniref:hypothetical protein n=1 Tax=Modestobacter sp. VKM Ac-2978 TaxID=3004132 RepID=UPI0022AAE5F3|nr:hypothetical protein [Modestobacter sp. VKM Ac-2978]MCZ2851009.1 hypothetical protein [Modestobacter sp. VKM Ac-2978]